MLLRGIGHPRGHDPEIAVRQTTSTVSSISSTTSSTHRPPKDFVIYALPEQSFWGVKKTKRRHNSDKVTNKIPSTPRLDDTPQTAQAIPVSLIQPEPEFNDTAASTSSRGVSDFYYETPQQSNIYHEENIVPTTQPPPPETTTTFATTTTPTTTSTTTSSTTPTPSPEDTLKMTLAEKKFHLGQCMRYCMDAILWNGFQ